MRPRVPGLRGLLGLAAWLLVTLPVGYGRAGEDDAALARRAFLVDRDTMRLEEALAGSAPEGPGALTEARLVGLAVEPQALAESTGGSGYDALVDVVGALRRLDLRAADRALERMRVGGVPAQLDLWVEGLLCTRRGRDAQARRVIRALAGPASPLEIDAFRLALLGASLPDDDRLFLAGTARAALLDASVEGDREDVERLARHLCALDRGIGAECLCLAARAFSRGGDAVRGEAILGGAEARWVADEPCLRIERAVWRWRQGRRRDATRLLEGMASAAGPGRLVAALRQGVGAEAGPPTPPPLEGHVNAERRAAHLLARFASTIGVPTTPAAVEARALALGVRPEEVTFAARFLAEQDLVVRPVAGGERGLAHATALGLPVLLLSIEPRGDAFEEVWRLVHARDAASGIWIAETANLGDPGLLVPGAGETSRMLVAAPATLAARATAGIPETEQTLGRLLLDAVDLFDRGRGPEAETRLRAGTSSPAPVASLYLAWLLHRRHRASLVRPGSRGDLDALREARSVSEPLLDHAPLPGFVPFAVAEGLVAESAPTSIEAAAVMIGRARAEEPTSAYLARMQYRVHALLRDGAEAVQAIGQARRLDPLDVVALYLRGHTRREIGQVELARRDLLRASDRRPEWVVAAMELVGLELGAGRPRDAIRHLDRLIDAVPGVEGEAAVRATRALAEGMLVQRASSVEDLRPLLESAQAETRRRVAFALGRWETDQAVNMLGRLLADADEAVRVTALKIYMRPWLRARVESDAGLGRRVIDVLREDTSELARGAAAGLLGLIRQPWATRELVGVLAGARRDGSPYLRAEAASALSRHEGVEARGALVGALEDEDAGVRRSAIEALFRIAATYRGYDPDAGPEQRAAAVKRWRAWIAEGSG